MGSWP